MDGTFTGKLSIPPTLVDEFCTALAKDVRLGTVPALNELPGVKCSPGEGAFYVFADCSGAIESLGLDDDHAFCEHLLEHAGVCS